MSLLNLSQQLSLSPKRVASTHGGEYHSPCPGCGGKDRFIIWEQEGRYYCRQCNVAGDAIQFCRDFMNMDFRSACQKLGVEKERSSSHYARRKFVPSVADLPSEIWQTRAMQFVQYCHKNLIELSQGLDFLHQRGLSLDTAKQYLLGWNPQILLDTKERWGLPSTCNEEGKERKQWLPHGFVIPTLHDDKLIKVKVHRNNPKEDDKLPKYVEISGSMKTPFVLKEMLNAALITIGTGGLYWHEKKSKEKEEVFIVPAAESLQENLFSTISDYREGHLEKYHYLSYMYEFEKLIYSFPDLTQKTNIESIKINKNKEVVFELGFPKVIIRDDGSFRCPTFEILNFGDYEPEVAALLYPILKDGDVIFDIGAGIGWYSINLSKRFPQSSVYAFEPIKDLFQVLTANVDNNKANNIKTFNYGIANKEGSQDFYYLKNQHEYLRNILEPMEQKCRVRTLQGIVNDLKINKLDLIKQELKVTEDAFLVEGKDVVDQFKPLVMFSLREYWDKELIETFEEDIQILEKIGYRKVIIGESIKKNLTREKHYFFYHPSKHKNININSDLENRLIQ